MKKIKLTRNKYSLVDDEDYRWMKELKWQCSSKGYAIRGIVGKTLLMARILMEKYGYNLEGKEIDHINLNPLDNRKENLRIVTHYQNMLNVTKNKNNTSGYKGVSFHKLVGKWAAYITVNKKRLYLGWFAKPEEA